MVLALLSWMPWSAAAEEGPGVLLVAAPGHGGEAFAETVLLLKRHARGGTIGVVLNRPTSERVDALIPGIPPPAGLAEHVFSGGPLETGQVIYLVRTAKHEPRNTLKVFEKVFLAFDLQLLHDILVHPIPLQGVRVFRGHARWARGALEAEIAKGAWYLVEADPDAIFDESPEGMWQRLVRQVEEQGVSAPGRDRSSRGAPAAVRW
jgi:putative transcriptional regulator